MQQTLSQLLKTIIVSLTLLIISNNSYAQGVIINEIMYDPQGSDTNREWVEVYNSNEFDDINLSGWKFFDGDGTTKHGLSLYQGTWTIPSQGYAVIVQKGATFTAVYGTNTGTIIECSALTLVNSTATIALINSSNDFVGSVTYSSAFGANNNGRSLERISPESNEWKESQILDGTPGRRNSVSTIETGTVTTRIKICPVSGRARLGGTYTVEIRIENVADLSGWQCSLGFNPSILQLITVEEGGFFRDAGSQTFWRDPDIGTGSLNNIACTKIGTSTGISGSGTLASIRFKIIGTSTNMPSYLELGHVTLSDSGVKRIPADMINGSVSVAYGFNINTDAAINIQDLVLVGRLFGISSGTIGYDQWCDINLDGTIDLLDIAAVSSNFSDVTDIVVSQSPRTSSSIQDKPAGITLITASTMNKVGDEIDVDLWIDNANNLYGIQFDIVTDKPDVLSLIRVSDGEFLKRGGRDTFWVTSPAADKFAQCRMKKVSGETGQGVIATIRFRANKEGTARINAHDIFGVSPDIEKISVNSTDISLHIVPLESNLSTSTCTVYPNPSLNNQHIYFDTSEQNAVVEIYTLSGELVKTITNSSWNLTNADNKPVASGMYFYILKTGDKVLQGKVGVIK
ncbi:MAG: cohesin domain-containing protein [bacterium]|nr:cohesin domain-containing protein [bacterium]